MLKETEKLVEIRWHGRGGQGVVTASKLLAEAALEEGKDFQALPDYGAERMGAPIRAYTRISSRPIVLHCQVTEPDVVVVTDSSLLSVINVTEGLKDGGLLIVNTALTPAEVQKSLGYNKGRIYTVDATAIAMETMGRNIPNVPMLGALLKAIEVVKKESMVSEIRSKLSETMKSELVEANLSAFEKAYNETKAG